jgi:hypothetical protein
MSRWIGALVMFLCLWAVAPLRTACADIFAVAHAYPAGDEPASVTTGDFDGDGRKDLAVANNGSGNVSVLLGNGDGTFKAAVNYAAGNGPRSVTTGDFDGDGGTDLAVANNGSGNVSVLLGNGDGTFKAAVNYAAGNGPNSVTTGDFDGDGRSDLAVTNYGSGKVSVLLGNGDGTFKPKVDYATGAYPSSVTRGDFDGDSWTDLVVTRHGLACVSVLLGNGDGTFKAAVNHATGKVPLSVTAEDFDGDGRTDLAVANYDSTNVSVLLGNGDGIFKPKVDYATGSHPSSVTTGDFDGDGRKDLAVANKGGIGYDGGSVSVLLGNGNGTFKAAIKYATGDGPSSVTTGDFNGDGRTDLSVANNGSDNVSVLLGLGDGTFKARGEYAAGRDPNSVTAGDFNGDGRADLAVANNGSDNVSVLLGNGDGTFKAAVNYTGYGADSVTTGDFDGDGRTDLAVADGSQYIWVLLGNGDGTFKAAVNRTAGLQPRSVTAGDFDGDGWADLAFAQGYKVSVLLGNGDGTFKARVNYAAGNKPQSVTTGDFDGDSRTDLAVANKNSNNLSVLLGNGDGTFKAAVNYGADNNPQSVTVGDFNADGRPDLAVANYVSRNVSVLLGNGDGTFKAKVNYGTDNNLAVGAGPQSVTTGDFDGDGRTDLAVANSTYTISVLPGKGDGTFKAAVGYSAGYSPSSVMAGDFDSDGRTDLAVAYSPSDSVSNGGALVFMQYAPLYAPSNLKAMAVSPVSAVLRWQDNSENETKYRIERKQGVCGSSAAWSVVGAVGPEEMRFMDNSLTPDTDYCYKVKVINGSGTAAYSNLSYARTSEAGTPVAPSGLTALSIASSGIRLTWTDKSSDETGFNVYRMKGTGQWGLIAALTAGVTTFTDNNAAGNDSTESYSYYVSAYNGSGKSPASSIAAVPYRPGELTTTASDGMVSLSWTVPATKNTGFEVWRKQDICASTSVPWGLLTKTGTDAISYDDASAASGVTYSYKVKTTNKSLTTPAATGYSQYNICVQVEVP